jgi:predicted transcriptional regulator
MYDIENLEGGRDMLGETLRELRESKHLSQKQLAEALFISPSAISQYESGRTRPSHDNFERKYWLDATDEDIACTMNISKDSVRMYLSRARKRALSILSNSKENIL